MKKKLFYLILTAAAVSLVCCNLSFQNSSKEKEYISSNFRNIDADYLKKQAYMGGSLLYNPSAPENGHIFKGAYAALRLGKTRKTIIQNEEVFVNNPESETFGFIKVIDIDPEKIYFSVVLFDEDDVAYSEKKYKLEFGGQADINDDNIPDLEFKSPQEKHDGFEDAVYLNFLSSPETLNTSMYAILPEQYKDSSYPAGIIGINPNGRFIYSKYNSSGQMRSVFTGISTGDFILDSEDGIYVEADFEYDGSGRNSQSLSKEVSIADVLPLASWRASSQNKKNTKLPVAAKNYNDFIAKQKVIKEKFDSYRKIAVLPSDSLKKEINSYGLISIDAYVGVFGKFNITWSHIESSLMAGIYLESEVELSVTDDMELKHSAGPYTLLEESKSFAAGPVTITVKCPMTFEMPIEFNLKGNPNAVVHAGFSGLYGACADVGAHINWTGKRKFIEPFSNIYTLTEGVCYVGTKDVSAEGQKFAQADICFTPSFRAEPAINISKTVWTQVKGECFFPVEMKITAKLNSEKYFDFDESVSLFYSGKVNWSGGIKAGPFKKEITRNFYSSGPSLIKKWELKI